jgi:hypothetical protein
MRVTLWSKNVYLCECVREKDRETMSDFWFGLYGPSELAHQSGGFASSNRVFKLKNLKK